MQHLSTAFLIIALVIVVNNGQGVTIKDEEIVKSDQVAEETKRNALTLIDGPKYVPKTETTKAANITVANNYKPEQRPPSKPPIFPDKPTRQKVYVDIQRPYYGNIQNLQRPQFSQPLKLFTSPNSVFGFPKVIPLPLHKNHYYIKQQPRPTVIYANNQTLATTPPKFNIPVQTVNGVRNDIVKPPKINTSKTNIGTTTVASLTTTKRYLRTKRIWPKKILEKMNAALYNNNKTTNYTNPTNITHKSDYVQSASVTRIRYVIKNDSVPISSYSSPTRRPYRPVTRIPKKRSTTPAINITDFENSDWVPIVPPHYTKYKRPPHSRNRRSVDIPGMSPYNNRMLYLQSFGLIPVPNLDNPQYQETPDISRKKMVYLKKKRQPNPYYSGYGKPVVEQYIHGDLQAEGSHPHKRSHPKVITKIKHHHHHHHHRYIKTVEKPVQVPYKVEVPKPYPVPVEKKVPVPVEKVKIVEKPVPYTVTVEKKIPYPIGIKVPHPVPYKVVEKEYVPKPYPVVHHIPITVEKKVPYPVEVRVPVDRPVPVTVEKQVPYPLPVKVLVPQPYPVETKVPYPVQVKVKEPVEVVKHVPVKVPVPQPFAVKVPVPVEKKVPYPVEVEKKIPVPVEIYVPQKVEVEKKIPVYIPKPYPVEKKVPVPVKVPYPVEVPIYVHSPSPGYNDYYGSYVSSSGVSVAPDSVTNTPEHTVTVHGNTGFAGFQSRSDNDNTASEPSSEATPLTTNS
ncbi:unnamed protein product [Diatraea saccharalis]|uniref:Uncharacterized protein n=1 Tax=Diatraea saccharalis TaxID=40085 RepID=A0A9N9N0Z3_9NEOP|nr:unnamed protein product [Diatraea saccharalis]